MELTLRIGALLLAALLAGGCDRQPYASQRSQETSNNSAAEPKLPFDQHPQNGGILPSSSLVPGRTLPAGTPLTIRLTSTISSTKAHPGDRFKAVLQEPVVMQGTSIVPVGTPVTGEVVAVKSSANRDAPAYLRLKLTSVLLQGKELSIESSSVFAKAGPQQRRSSKTGDDSTALSSATPKNVKKRVEFAADRRLTFRLTEPIWLPE